MAALRSSAKTANLSTALHTLRQGPSARQLPPIVESLSVRYNGVKGGAGARHWSKQVLPSLVFANPAVKVVVEEAPKKVEAEEGAAESSSEPWTQPPGITVTFNDSSLPTSFFPLPPVKSDKLVSKFWATFGEEASLRAFVEGEEVAEVLATPVAKVEGQQQEPEAAGTAEAAEGATVTA